MYSFWQKILDIVSREYELNLYDLSNWLTIPPKSDLWDYAFSCFSISKQKWLNPTEISSKLANIFNEEIDYFYNVTSTWWYVNFFLNDKTFTKEIKNIDINDRVKNNETIVVDYIWTNLWKPLHIGHICTPSIWQSLINVYNYLGYTVISDSHFWDWGLFGKLVAAYKLYGNREELIKDPIEYLLSLYIRITEESLNDKNIEETARQEFKKLSDWDRENTILWQEFVSYSLDAINRILELINVKPDYDIWESFYEWLDLPKNWNYPDLKYSMQDIVVELLEKWIASKNEDWSVWVVFPEETKMPSCILQKKDWTSLYLTSDLACIKYRLENWNPSKILYHVDVRQQLHLKQAFWISNNAWPELNKTELFHVYNWFIKLKEWAMSTRKWTIIRLKDLIDEWFIRTANILKTKWKDWDIDNTNTRAIAIAAIKYSYLSQDREKDVVFDWDKALNFEGNSWPYIQYAYVRACKVLNQVNDIWDFDNSSMNPVDKSLTKKLFEFENKVLEAANKYKPHIIAQYCYELSSQFNSFYVNSPKILEEKDENIRNMRLKLIELTRNILKKWFELLAIDMPTEM